MTEEEVLVAIYCQTVAKAVNGDNMRVASYWLPKSKALSDEHFHLAVGLANLPQG